MFNSKIASLEARIARLESKLSRTASVSRTANPTVIMSSLVQYLNMRWEEAGGKFSQVAGTMIEGVVDAVDASVTLKLKGPNVKMIVTGPAYNGSQKYEDEVPFVSNQQVSKALEQLIGEVDSSF